MVFVIEVDQKGSFLRRKVASKDPRRMCKISHKTDEVVFRDAFLYKDQNTCYKAFPGILMYILISLEISNIKI